MNTLNIKQSLLAFVSSNITLFIIFLYTMFIHDRQIDFEYLLLTSPRIILISAIPAILVLAIKTKSMLRSIVIGVLVGIISATIYVQVVNAI
jgi:hypothetical protein